MQPTHRHNRLALMFPYAKLCERLPRQNAENHKKGSEDDPPLRASISAWPAEASEFPLALAHSPAQRYIRLTRRLAATAEQ